MVYVSGFLRGKARASQAILFQRDIERGKRDSGITTLDPLFILSRLLF
jgi:hypothetical protein